MTAVVAIVTAFAWLLIAATVVQVVRSDRGRQPHTIDIALFVGALALTPWVSRFGFRWLHVLLLSVQPWLAMRLVGRLRPVGRVVETVIVSGAVVAALLTLLRPPPPISWIGAYHLVAFGAVTVLLAGTSAGSTGITRRRVVFAATATVLQALTALMPVASELIDLSRPGAAVTQLLMSSALIAYYFAFATPRWLLGRWQRQEHARYLSDAAEREPVERGRLAADDLNRAAARGVPNAATLVALREPVGSRDLVIHAGVPALIGARVPHGEGLVSRTMRSGMPADGPAGACDAPIGPVVAAMGERALVAPVRGSGDKIWGVVLAVQRRGSLFPEDDLRLLQQYGRYAATALDHAELIAEARARERRAAERKLREMESRMALMLDSIKDYAMFVLDVHGVVVNWHVGARHIFGYASEEMSDAPAAPLFALSPPHFAALLEEARALGIARREGPCLRRDGGRFIGATVIRPLDAGEDGVMGFVAVTRDITEQRDLESRLRQSQKMEAIGQLAGGIAHDFNNLLTAIQGYAEWLERGLSKDDPRLLEVNQILRASERAAGLTRQLLTFSRGQMLPATVIVVSTLVGELLPMLRRVIGEHIEIDDRTGGQSTVVGDRSQLEQIILNLVVNARDAMPGGGRLTIATRSVWLDEQTAAGEVPPGRYVALTVSDTGVGMDAPTQARIFEPFFTTKEMGHGTGLGLATVYGIVKQMGGLVQVSSHPGAGTTFDLYFPEASAPERVTENHVPDATPRGQGTILVVEDDAAVCELVRHALERHGYRVLAAAHQAAALELARAHEGPIHLLVTDVVMPGGSGPELVTALERVRPGIPALYISGYADAALRHASGAAAGVPLLQKPFGATELLRQVRQRLASAS